MRVETANDLEAAISLAMSAHVGQRDRGGSPYILHPLRVMMACGSPEHKIVAVLHDVVEDSAVTLHMIADSFGLEVMSAVDALTRRTGEYYDQHIERCARNPIAREVKLADLADNMDLTRMSNPQPGDLVRWQKYRDASERLRSAD